MRIIAAVTIALCLAGCTRLRNKPAPPPKFPEAPTVSLVEVIDGKSISDPREIEKFLGEVRNIHAGWSFTWDTYPTPQKSAFLKDKNNQVLCRVDFGPRWIGSDCGLAQKGWPPSTETSAAQDQYFQTFLGAKWHR